MSLQMKSVQDVKKIEEKGGFVAKFNYWVNRFFCAVALSTCRSRFLLDEVWFSKFRVDWSVGSSLVCRISILWQVFWRLLAWRDQFGYHPLHFFQTDGGFGWDCWLVDGFLGSIIRTLLHEKINPKDWQVVSLGDVGFLLFFRVVSFDYGKPWFLVELNQLEGWEYPPNSYWHCLPKVPAGTVLWRAGEPCSYCVCVTEGTLHGMQPNRKAGGADRLACDLAKMLEVKLKANSNSPKIKISWYL